MIPALRPPPHTGEPDEEGPAHDLPGAPRAELRTLGASDTAAAGQSLDAGHVRGVVICVHGGAVRSEAQVSWSHVAVRRSLTLAHGIAEHCEDDIVVCQLRFAIGGWNEDGEHARRDLTWALGRVQARWPGVAVVVVGHSLGGRVALAVVHDELVAARNVAGVVALAPWLPPGQFPVEPEAVAVPVQVIHGIADVSVSWWSTRSWVARSRGGDALVGHRLVWGGHGMLVRVGTWHRLAAEAVTEMLTRFEQSGRTLEANLGSAGKKHTPAGGGESGLGPEGRPRE